MGCCDHGKDTGFHRDNGKFIEPTFHNQRFNKYPAIKTKLVTTFIFVDLDSFFTFFSFRFKIKYLRSVPALSTLQAWLSGFLISYVLSQ